MPDLRALWTGLIASVVIAGCGQNVRPEEPVSLDHAPSDLALKFGIGTPSASALPEPPSVLAARDPALECSDQVRGVVSHVVATVPPSALRADGPAFSQLEVGDLIRAYQKNTADFFESLFCAPDVYPLAKTVFDDPMNQAAFDKLFNKLREAHWDEISAQYSEEYLNFVAIQALASFENELRAKLILMENGVGEQGRVLDELLGLIDREALHRDLEQQVHNFYLYRFENIDLWGDYVSSDFKFTIAKYLQAMMLSNGKCPSGQVECTYPSYMKQAEATAGENDPIRHLAVQILNVHMEKAKEKQHELMVRGGALDLSKIALAF